MLKVILGVGFFLSILIIWLVVVAIRRRLGIWKLRHYALPREWLEFIHTNVPIYSTLPWELRAPVQDMVISFVDGKFFRRAGDLEDVTPEMQVTIAAHAVIMLANQVHIEHANVQQIFVYPKSIYDTIDKHGQALGEAMTESSVAIVWDDVKKTATDLRDYQNSALSAVSARLGLDIQPTGSGNIPFLRFSTWARARYDDWAQFVKHKAPALSEKHLNDTPVEFFIIAVEAFFSNPETFQKKHGELYAVLRQFFKVDPARWTLTHT